MTHVPQNRAHVSRDSRLQPWLRGPFKSAVLLPQWHCLPRGYPAACSLFFPMFSLFPTTLQGIFILSHSTWQRGISSCQQNFSLLSFAGKSGFLSKFLVCLFVFLSETRDQWLHRAQDIVQGEISQPARDFKGLSCRHSSHRDAPQLMEKPWEKHCELRYQTFINMPQAGDTDGHFVSRMRCENMNYDVPRYWQDIMI